MPAADVARNYTDKENLSAVINRYVTAQHIQAEAMKGAQIDEVIGASVPKLQKRGNLRVLKNITKVGEITFRRIGSFIGDDTIRKEVIERFLTEEQKQRDTTALSITPENYTFKMKAVLTEKTETPRTIYV